MLAALDGAAHAERHLQKGLLRFMSRMHTRRISGLLQWTTCWRWGLRGCCCCLRIVLLWRLRWLSRQHAGRNLFGPWVWKMRDALERGMRIYAPPNVRPWRSIGIQHLQINFQSWMAWLEKLRCTSQMITGANPTHVYACKISCKDLQALIHVCCPYPARAAKDTGKCGGFLKRQCIPLMRRLCAPGKHCSSCSRWSPTASGR